MINQQDIEVVSSCFERLSNGPPLTGEIKRCHRLATTYGFEYIGHGGFREVYHFDDDKVVKFPSSSGGEDQNLEERKNWKKIEGTSAEKYFAEVHSSAQDGSWLLMDKVNPKTPDDITHRNLNGELRKLGIKCRDLRDPNVGYDSETENLIFFDYGKGCEFNLLDHQNEFESYRRG